MATTTNYSWSTPDDTALVKDGASAIRTLGSSVDTTLYTALGGTYPGLRLVKKQTIGTGVSSVTVTNAFSATYDNYKIIISGGVGSAGGANLAFQLGATTTNYVGVLNYANFNGTTNSPAGSSSNNWTFLGSADTNGLNFSAELTNPFLARNTYVQGQYIATLAAGGFTGRQNSTTSFTDFTIYPNTGTLTGGTIYVYGFGAS